MLAPTSLITFEEALVAGREGDVSRNAARVLIRSREGEQLDSLMSAAAELRNRVKGRSVTYSKKVFIPLTNLCRDYCGYCTFRKDPGQAVSRKKMPHERMRASEQG